MPNVNSAAFGSIVLERMGAKSCFTQLPPLKHGLALAASIAFARYLSGQLGDQKSVQPEHFIDRAVHIASNDVIGLMHQLPNAQQAWTSPAIEAFRLALHGAFAAHR